MQAQSHTPASTDTSASARDNTSSATDMDPNAIPTVSCLRSLHAFFSFPIPITKKRVRFMKTLLNALSHHYNSSRAGLFVRYDCRDAKCDCRHPHTGLIYISYNETDQTQSLCEGALGDISSQNASFQTFSALTNLCSSPARITFPRVNANASKWIQTLPWRTQKTTSCLCQVSNATSPISNRT